MPPFHSSSTDHLLGNTDTSTSIGRPAVPRGFETRQQVEKRLLQKLDLRVFFLAFVNALRHVSLVDCHRLEFLQDLHKD